MKQLTYTFTRLLLMSFVSYAQPGSLDLTFSGDGKQTTPFLLPAMTTKDNGAHATAIQADGKVVVVGYTYNGSQKDFSVVRYNATGTLDNTFNMDGKLTTNFSGYDDEAYAVAIQTNGKIVVAGYSSNGSTTVFAVARYNPNGTLDHTFSGDGKAITAIGIHDVAHSVAVQADGKIVVAGYSGIDFSEDFALVRYNTDGTLDNTFDVDGMVTTGFSDNSEDQVEGVAIQGDGKIVLTGYTVESDGYSSFAVARYNTDGSPDNTFSGDGKLTTLFTTATLDVITDARATSVAIQADGKIVVAGFSQDDFYYDEFALVRYSPDGTLDKTFSGDGILTTDVGGYGYDDIAYAVAIQGNGKIVAAGYAINSATYSDFALARYNTDGTPDITFSGDGKLTTAMGTNNDAAQSVAIQGNGMIVTAGYAYSNAKKNFAVARYKTDGTLDNGFATDGKLITDVGGADVAAADNGYAVVVRGNGKIITVGTSTLSGNIPKQDIAIAQYNANGTPDNAFGFKGMVLNEFEGGNFVAQTATLQADGKLIVGGAFSYGNVGKQDFALARYNVDGSLDNTFSSDGFLTTDISGFANACTSVAVQADGKIVAAGWSRCLFGCYSDFTLVRYNANGTLDNFFSVDGMQTTDFLQNADVITSVLVQQDGKIVAAGYSYNGSNYVIAVARYTAAGDLDATFNGGGKQTTSFTGYDAYGQSVKIQADGKLVVGGYSGKTSVKDNDFVLVRYNTNGTLDNTFSGDGKQNIAIEGTSQDYCTSIAIQSSGKIVAGGYYINSFNQADFALARCNSDGTLDNTFGSAGRITTDFANTNDYGKSVAIGGDGKLLMAGYSNNDFAVARYNLAATTTLAKTAASNISKQPLMIEILPNPFTATTVITYTLETDGIVTIDLIDALGKKVKTVENRKLTVGTHQVELNRENLPAGIYFIRIIKDQEVTTKKILIN